jgi:hypothetical protein
MSQEIIRAFPDIIWIHVSSYLAKSKCKFHIICALHQLLRTCKAIQNNVRCAIATCSSKINCSTIQPKHLRLPLLLSLIRQNVPISRLQIKLFENEEYLILALLQECCSSNKLQELVLDVQATTNNCIESITGDSVSFLYASQFIREQLNNLNVSLCAMDVSIANLGESRWAHTPPLF